MTHIAKAWATLSGLVRLRRVQLSLAVRVTTAAIAAFALALTLQLPLPLWAVLTAVIVTQVSVGRSLKATFDYLVGTVSGAIYGGIIGVVLPNTGEITLLVALALCVGPLAFIAAMRPGLSVAPITAIIVLLVPTFTHASPYTSALDRILEVALGGGTGFIVSLLVLPSNAHRLLGGAAARALNQMARALEELLAHSPHRLDIDELHRIQDGIGVALVRLNAVGAEAEHERSARLAAGPETAPLLRTLLRLRHDLVMIGRATVEPLPPTLAARLEPSLARAGSALADYMRASAGALLARQGPPALDAVGSALSEYAAEVAALRSEGLTRNLSIEATERLFAVGFALDQMHRNFKDLERCVADWARSSRGLWRRGAKPAAEKEHDG